MKKTILLLLSITLTLPLLAENPKREMRATWLTLVSNIDWPSAGVKSVASQKAELTRMLDSIASLNMNTVFFHIRPACDAAYISKYEPWSCYLNNPRGHYPGYDPLAFCIEECHKRGLTCHGWINPYRYSNRSGDNWSGNNDTTKLNYAKTHPEWLLHYSGSIVLDPALPQVRQRIKEVVGDIISRYDIDGILMDDYFYPYGGTTNQDAKSVAAYKPDNMNVDDWRRSNINQMVQDVYDTIQAIKPWVTFGVSPFGIWTTNYRVAQERGYTLPSNITGGNMYQEIYCDPVAWLEQGCVDYLSPQLYWKIGGGQDYRTLSQWWGNMCSTFGKHFYSSMAIYRYAEKNSSNTAFTVDELHNQALLNRSAVKDAAPGAVFYNTKAWVYDKPFRKTFKAGVFAYPSLPPAINWKSAPEQKMVSNLQIAGNTLSWTHESSDVHFAIYAVPKQFRNRKAIFSEGEALLAISYSTSFTLPANINSSMYAIAVSVLDRYNNEYSLRVLGESEATPETTTLLSPRAGDCRKLPFEFEWQAIGKADSYVIQMARDAECKDIVFAQEVVDNRFSTELRKNIAKLPHGTYYWRVKTRKANCNDIWTEAVPFIIGTADALENVTTSHDKHIYSLLGQYLGQDKKNLSTGIYIVNGQVRLLTNF